MDGCELVSVTVAVRVTGLPMTTEDDEAVRAVVVWSREEAVTVTAAVPELVACTESPEYDAVIVTCPGDDGAV